MKINYRKLLPEESKMYRAIRLESLKTFPESFCASYEEALKTEKFRTEIDIEEQTPDRFVMGAFADEELIGLCVLIKNENNTATMYQMYVKKEFQGKSIGLGLIQAVILEANNTFGNLEIMLEVTPGNDTAYFLYKKAGFNEIEDHEIKESSGSLTMKYTR